MNYSPQQLLNLAVFMGLAEARIEDEVVLYRKPGYEFPAVYEPHKNPKQGQALQQHLNIGMKPDYGDWIASVIKDGESLIHTVATEDDINGAITSAAVKYLERG